MKAFMRFFIRIHIFMYRLTSGKVAGRVQGLTVLLLTTQGRRSGRERTVPLGTFEDGGAYIVTASNSGSDVDPGWFINLKSQPHVRIQVGPRSIDAEAHIVEGAERTRLWNRLVSLSPGYGRYEKSTKRVIPLIALRP
jgi:deazaflavin-dependent oxidoreductase (nitroreductase family)